MDQSEGAQRCETSVPVTTKSQGGSGGVGGWVGGWVGVVRSLPVATAQLLVAMDKLTGR